MKKKYIIVLLTLLVVITGTFLVFHLLQPDPANKTDAEIKQMFGCNSINTVYTATQIYCSQPDLYREHVRNNEVISAGDFDNLDRQQAIAIQQAKDYRPDGICTQVVTRAVHEKSGATYTFSNGCLPPGWKAK